MSENHTLFKKLQPAFTAKCEQSECGDGKGHWQEPITFNKRDLIPPERTGFPTCTPAFLAVDRTYVEIAFLQHGWSIIDDKLTCQKCAERLAKEKRKRDKLSKPDPARFFIGGR